MGIYRNNSRRKNLHLRSTLNPTVTLPKGLAPVPGWPNKFATPDGRVFSVKEVGYCNHGDGYLRVSVRLSARKILRPGVHQLVALAFLGPPPKRTKNPEVRHLNGKKTDNRACNLAWGSRQDNASDTAKHGTLRGERNPRSKLTASEVRSIRKSKESRACLAARYKVSVAAIKQVLTRNNWKHVK